MRKRLINSTLLFCSIALIISCVRAPEEKSCMSRNVVQSDGAKPAQAQLTPELQKLMAHFKEGKMPLYIDSVMMSKAYKGDSLGTEEVKMLTRNWIKTDTLQEYGNGFSDFYTIDSAKAKGAYAKWAEKLDIGMTAYSNAYALQKIKLNDTVSILLWALTRQSYDADPISSDTTIYATLVNKANVAKCFFMGMLSMAADPPGAGQTLITSKWNDNNIVYNETSLQEDIDESTGVVTKTQYCFLLADGHPVYKSRKDVSQQKIKFKE